MSSQDSIVTLSLDMPPTQSSKYLEMGGKIKKSKIFKNPNITFMLGIRNETETK